MKKDFLKGFENLESKLLLSFNPWYIEAIEANKVWQSLPVSVSRPVVAIVDSGADLNHELLKNNLWKNPKDPIDGIDNDGNGYVDDSVGWDFVQNDRDPQGGFYHGTHVAGIVKEVSNGNVDLMILRFQDNNGLGYAGAAAYAINYAVQMKKAGVNLAAINCSFGGLSYNSSVIDNAIKNASNNNILVVIAGGNEGVDTDLNPRYPGSLKYTNTITVAAIDQNLALAGYSNYGKNSIEIASPGSNIYSSLPNNNYGYVSGTSMAAPMVSAAAGLLKTLGGYGAYQIKSAIMQGAGAISGLSNKIQSGLLNVLKSWNLIRDMRPSDIIEIKSLPSAVLVSPIMKIESRIDILSSIQIKGKANIVNSSSKAIVQVYINNILRYQVRADQYRLDTKAYNGFNISINRRFLNLRSNLLEIRIKDPLNRIDPIIYKKYIRK